MTDSSNVLAFALVQVRLVVIRSPLWTANPGVGIHCHDLSMPDTTTSPTPDDPLVASNPEARRASMARWRRDNPARYAEARRRYKLRTYGLDVEAYEALLVLQGGRCAICGDPEKDDWDLAVDHDHRTGVVRGLLCRRCNVGIGLLRDDAGVLASAADYVRSRSSSPVGSGTLLGPLKASTAAASSEAPAATAKAIP